MSPCEECDRLKGIYGDAARQLMTAQWKLAHYRAPEETISFQRFWDECRAALETSQRLREQMLQHLGEHQTQPVLPDASEQRAAAS